jgi:hypothetical protein
MNGHRGVRTHFTVKYYPTFSLLLSMPNKNNFTIPSGKIIVPEYTKSRHFCIISLQFANYLYVICRRFAIYMNDFASSCRLLFYVTDGNIMYLTDACRFLISCVIQHYAPVVGWGGGGTDA